jgi:sugar phosphate isomerase/epimerase
MTRRELIAGAGIAATLPLAPETAGAAPPPKFRLGTVTYNVARDWDMDTLIAHCKASGLEGVELRTTHKHGVEIALDKTKRKEIRQKFVDSGVTLWGLGTTCEFHADNPATVLKNVEECKQWCELAHDVGATGVKVRPNGFPNPDKPQPTLEQIGKALKECAGAADANGVEIWVEVHGNGTSHPPHIRTLLDVCAHPRVGACWNSNKQDILNGSVKPYFDLLKSHLKSCHINDLWSDYPYRELFRLLAEAGYDRFTLCEVGAPIAADSGTAFLKCYRGLWRELCR